MTINLENLYRGVINQDETFYLAARLNSSMSASQKSTMLSSLGLTSVTDDPHFMLCLDRYENSGIQYHRLYWSNDPKDFVPQLKSNSQNQGATQFTFSTNTRGNTYDLFYRTNVNYQKFDDTLITYGLDNIDKTTAINQERNNSFIIVVDEEKNYNLSNNIHTSVPYNITSSNSQNQNWNFRINLSTGSGGSSDRPEVAKFTNSGGLVNLRAKAVKITDTPAANIINNNQLDLNGFAATVGFLGLDDIPENNGIVFMQQGSNEEYFSYTKFNKSTKFMNLGTRGMFDTPSFTPTTGSTLTITICIENHDDNFETIEQLLAATYDTSTSFLDIFFIPTNGNIFLTTGVNLENITNYILPSTSINYYNYIDGIIYEEGIGVRDISFLTNYLADTLPANFSSTKMDSSYPFIPVYDSSNNVNSSSTVIWTNLYESLKSFYYNYCRGNDLCGSCMGVTETRAYQCHVNNNTLENYKKNTVAGNLNVKNAANPLSDTPRNSNINSIYKNYTIPIIILAAFIFVMLIIGAVYLGLIKEKNIDLSKIVD